MITKHLQQHMGLGDAHEAENMKASESICCAAHSYPEQNVESETFLKGGGKLLQM